MGVSRYVEAIKEVHFCSRMDVKCENNFEFTGRRLSNYDLSNAQKDSVCEDTGSGEQVHSRQWCMYTIMCIFFKI